MLLQKTVTFSAKIYKCGLKAWFNARDDCLVNVAMDNFFSLTFNMEFFKLQVLDFGNSAFLRIYGIDKDFIAHEIVFQFRLRTIRVRFPAQH